MDDFDRLPTFEAGCQMPSARTIQASDANYRTAAEIGSSNLLVAMLRYGCRHGLPNISADTCWRKLGGMA